MSFWPPVGIVIFIIIIIIITIDEQRAAPIHSKRTKQAHKKKGLHFLLEDKTFVRLHENSRRFFTW